MARLAKDTWVLVADGEKALFLRNDLDAENPNLTVVSAMEQDNPADREQGTHKPGRMPDTGMGQRSSLDDTDWHQLAKDRFADDLAEILYKRAHRHRFDKIVLVAPPKVLGALRKTLHKEVADKVVAEIAKDLTNHPIDAIESLLVEELAA